ncbi:MAG: transglutaminase domain-containing protein [Solirubrobacteraceae bacterium]|nr:transglutaminase domain-containing protein [Solirubrobacteraceae bacterium]
MIETAPTQSITARPLRVIAWTRTVAVLVLGFGAIAVWWPVLGSGTLWILPVLLVTAAVAGNALELRDRRLRLAWPWLWLLWTPVAFVLAGLPAWTLNPLQLGTTLGEMARALATGLRDPGAVGDPWMLGAWLYLCGLMWFVGSSQARRETRGAAATAFFMFAAPFAASLAFGGTGDAAWQGGAILVGGLLWATRGNLRDGLPALAIVAVAGVAVAALIAPTERWSGLDPQNRGKPKFSTLSSDQTYGPSRDRKTGATMFDIRAERPSLWRMEVLQEYDGRVWKTNLAPQGKELPQPAARRTVSTVRLDGLRSELAIAPGRIKSVSSSVVIGNSPRPGTEAVSLSLPVRSGESYTVVSEEVLLTPALADVKVPRGEEYRELTDVFPGNGPNPAVGNFPAEASGSAYGQVVALAEQLSSGTDSQLEIVERVEDYLTRSGLFKYSLDVPQPGSFPLVEFLLETRKGYCQHFAGAAAMLLRMAGIPSRVVTGFATGLPSGDGEWKVRDKEAHAWIEVYFPGHGWVAFNPTPASAEAEVAPGVGAADKRQGDRSVAGAKIPLPLVLGALGLLGALALIAHRLRAPRREPQPLGDVLASIVPAPAGPAMTFAELRADLADLGPAVSALAVEAELQRFGPQAKAPEASPRRRVWRALVADVGVARAARIMALGPGRRPIVDGGGPKVATSAPPPSVAPPGRAGQP